MAIGQLPDVQASLIIYFYLEHKSLEEITEKLDLSVEEFSIEHHAALTMLRQIMHRVDGL